MGPVQYCLDKSMLPTFGCGTYSIYLRLILARFLTMSLTSIPSHRNTPRAGYPGSPIKEKFRKKKNDPTETPSQEFTQIKAKFENMGSDPTMEKAELYFQDQRWGSLGHGDTPLSVNTYHGHQWNVKVNGAVVQTWTINEQDGLRQKFSI